MIKALAMKPYWKHWTPHPEVPEAPAGATIKPPSPH